MNIDLDQLRAWEGRTETRCERIHPVPARAMAAVMDREACEFADGELLPAGWQWLYLLPLARQSEIGADGHARRGGFLPPVPLPRRMWVSGSMRWEDPLRIGDQATRISRIESVQAKQGRTSGAMVIVTLVHTWATLRGPALTETQTLVYREGDTAQATVPGTQAARGETWRMDIVPDPVLLFRYSALTFNGHRIHYDRDYATGVEHYPGLVVQGPLVASQLLELLHRSVPGRSVREFAFRALRPLFDSAPFSVCGSAEADKVALWTRDAQGLLTMEASATLA